MPATVPSMTFRCDRVGPRDVPHCRSVWERHGRASAAAGALASVGFSACYVYSPHGHGAVSEDSRLLRARVKAADVDWLAKYAARVHEQALDKQRFPGLFGQQVILIPIPGCAPATSGLPWAAERLAIALKDAGLACAVWVGLRRTVAVRKSATAPCRERPSVQDHYQSLAVDRSLVAPEQLVLVDDIVTKGRTLLAGTMRLHEAFPHAQIRAFALLRTMGLVPDIGRLLEPCQGKISWVGEDAHRDP